MTIYSLIFYVLAILVVAATAVAITRRQIVHAALYLIVAFLGTAAIFFLLGAPLLAAFMVIIYAGAIMVLFIFVIMLFGRPSIEIELMPRWGPAAMLGLVFLCIPLAMVFKDPGSGAVLQGAVAQPGDFGRFLFERYWLAVEIVSVLLLVALIVAVHVGKAKSSGDEQERGNSAGEVSP